MSVIYLNRQNTRRTITLAGALPDPLPVEKGIFCPPLGLYFPSVLKVVQTVTEEDLDLLQIPQNIRGEVALGQATRYHLGGYRLIGSLDVTPIICVDQEHSCSYILRHHASQHEAGAYVQGSNDRAVERCEITSFEGAWFTFAPVQTKKHWPTPMVYYTAEYPDPTEPYLGIGFWEVAFDVHGRVYNHHFLEEPEDLEDEIETSEPGFCP